MKLNRAMIVYGIFHVNVRENKPRYYLFNEEITKSIEDRLAVSATEASVKEAHMRGAQIITDVEKNFELRNQLYHKEQNDNTLGFAEVIVLLELITVLEQRGRQIRNSKVKIGFDNRKHHCKIVYSLKKSNVYAQEAGAEIAMIKKLLNKIQFEVEIILV